MALKMCEYPSAGQSKALQNIVAMACWMEVVVPYWNEEPAKKTKTPFLFLFLTSLLERPYRGK